MLKVIHQSRERNLGPIELTVSVVKLDHMTQHQVQMAAVLTGTVTVLGGIATFLSTILGIWHPH